MAIMCMAGILAVKGILEYMAGAGPLYGVLAALAALAAAVLAMVWNKREPSGKRKLRHALFVLSVFGTAAMRMYGVSAQMRQYLTGLWDDMPVAVQGRIAWKQCKETKTQSDESRLSWTVCLTDSYLKTSRGISPCGTIILYFHTDPETNSETDPETNLHTDPEINSETDPDTNLFTNLHRNEPVIGNILTAEGKIKFFESARNKGNFDERAYYQNQGYTLKVYGKEGSCRMIKSDRQGLKEALYRLRQNFQKVYVRRMPEEEAGALSAMLLGEKSLLSGDTKELYQRSGIAHILAISGLHISILGMAVYRFCRKRGVSFGMAGAVSLGLLLLFGLMTGMGLSTIRAVSMFGIYLGAAWLGRAYDSMNSLAVTAVFVLLQNPGALFLAGFQFSFAAVAGVLYGRWLCGIFKPAFRLTENVYMSLGIQMLTLPLTAWYYYEIPVYSVLLNMLVLPLMELVLVTGLAGGALGLAAAAISGAGISVFSLAGGLCGRLADVLLYLCAGCLRYFSGAGSFFLRLKGAVYVTGQPEIWVMALYFLTLLWCIWKNQEIRERRTKPVVTVSGLLCLGMLLCRVPAPAEVSVLDVGQGDGIYIHTGDGQHIFIDGGSSDVTQAGTYRILPFLKAQGVAAVDAWFVSHLDQDHINGLVEVVESGYDIRQVVLAAGVVEDEAYVRLSGLLARERIEVRYMEKGDTLSGGSARFTCLAPAAAQAGSDRNEQSLVLLYEEPGFRGFFSGDISSGTEQKLVREGTACAVTLYKAAHHGSEYSNSNELLEQLRPGISVISCGKKNRYGHPGKEAVIRMEEHSGCVYNTMVSGQVRIRWNRHGTNTEVCGYVKYLNY